ncbi:hypothetical protein ACQUW5_06880 [Legionella sp. CNM-1927-20]|uniref:hypothetical protein n=1 Tax=Legionella sp. CNM-1927-20 TaxID=3422221 RepID=UPI00403B1247
MKYFIGIFMLFLSNLPAQALTINKLNKAEDNILHTTVFHNKDHKTLEFLVTFGVGYGDGNNCQIVKQRVFKAIHPDGFEAHNYGRYLAKEYGSELFTCVHENLHVMGSQYPDENMTYSLTNNGEYYTSATPNKTDVYPK